MRLECGSLSSTNACGSPEHAAKTRNRSPCLSGQSSTAEGVPFCSREFINAAPFVVGWSSSIDDQRFTTIASLLTTRGALTEKRICQDGPTAEHWRFLVVINRCSFHREPDGSDRRLRCQLHISINQGQALSCSTYIMASIVKHSFSTFSGMRKVSRNPPSKHHTGLDKQCRAGTLRDPKAPESFAGVICISLGSTPSILAVAPKPRRLRDQSTVSLVVPRCGLGIERSYALAGRPKSAAKTQHEAEL
jgi:hypothetical protein